MSETDGVPGADGVSREMQEAGTLNHDKTLKIGRSISLTLGSDSLVVVDERAANKHNRNCCGLRCSKSDTPVNHAISLYNILNAELFSSELTITYVKPVTMNDVAVTALQFPVDVEERRDVEAWVADLLCLAYGEAKCRKRLKVLINPFGGKGMAPTLYAQYAEPIFTAARCTVELETTKYRGHATEIARNIDVDSYDAIVCCSGDGLPYEVFNGLGERADAREALAKLAVAMIPAGSGNAMAWNLYGTGSVSVSALTIVKGLRMPMDLISITQGQKRTLSFVSQSFGIIAECDLCTENIRWMGAHRFTYGFLVRLIRRRVWPCELVAKVEMDDKQAIKDHYRSYAKANLESPGGKRDVSPDDELEGPGLPPLKYGTVLDEVPSDWETIPGDTMVNFYAGKMPIVSKDAPFFPASLPNDGMIDLLTIYGDTSRMRALKMMDAIPNGQFFDMPEVKTRKITAYRLTPLEKEGYMSIDGESVSFEPFQAEIHKGLGTVLSKSGRLYEADGPK